jgi:two-component system CheB/CheR fusion protein
VLFRTRSLEDTEASKGPIPRGAAGKPQKELLRVREELRATKESLQAIIEEQEATNEELKSANEEIESSNEELQSSNEELETAKEELQSTNEELHTLNEELNTRNVETATINNDLQNLLASINLPIVMVDNALTIRRATPFAEKLFNLIPSDVGRKLTDIKSNLDLPDLETRIRKVIETLETQEHEVHDKTGRTYSLRIRPYRTRDHKIDGAVITLVDVEDILRTRPNRENLRRSVETLADTLREPVLLLMPDLRICAANRPYRETYHFRKKDLDDRSLFDIDDGRWNFAELRAALDASPPPHRKVHNIEAPRVASDTDVRPLLISGCSFPVGTDSILLLTFSHREGDEA